MDTREAKSQVERARQTLVAKGAPLEGTAAGHLILALESLIANLDNSLGYTRKVTLPANTHKAGCSCTDCAVYNR